MSYSACTCIQVLNVLNDEQVDREFAHLGLELEEDVNIPINAGIKRELIKARLQSLMDTKCLDLLLNVSSPMYDEGYSPTYSTISKRSGDCSCSAMEDALDEIVQKLETLGREHLLCQNVQEKVILLNETFLNLDHFNNSSTEYINESSACSPLQDFTTTSFIGRPNSVDTDSQSVSDGKPTLYRSSSWSLPFSSPSTSQRTTAESLSSHLSNSDSQNLSLSHISSITGFDRDYETLEVSPNVNVELEEHHYEPLRCSLPENVFDNNCTESPHYELLPRFPNSITPDNVIIENYCVDVEYWSYVNPGKYTIERVKSMPNLDNYLNTVGNPAQSVSYVSSILTKRQPITNVIRGELPSSPDSKSSITSSSSSPNQPLEHNHTLRHLKDLDLSGLKQQFARKRLASIFERGLIEMDRKEERGYWLRLKLRTFKRASTHTSPV